MRCRFPEFYVLSIFAGRHNGKWFSLQSGIQLSSFSISGWDLILSRGVVGFLVTGSLGVSDRIFYWRRSTFRLHWPVISSGESILPPPSPSSIYNRPAQTTSPTLFQCWASVEDACTTLKQSRFLSALFSELAQFSLYVHKGGLKPDSFHFISFILWMQRLLPLVQGYTIITRNKFVTSWKFQHMFLKQHRKTYQKSSKIRLVLVPEIGVLRGKWG